MITTGVGSWHIFFLGPSCLCNLAEFCELSKCFFFYAVESQTCLETQLTGVCLHNMMRRAVFFPMLSEHGIVPQPTACIVPAKGTKAHLKPRGILQKSGGEEKSWPGVLGWPCKCRYSDKGGTSSHGFYQLKTDR